MTEILGEHIYSSRLSRHLIAEFRAVDYDGKLQPNEPVVVAAVIDGGTFAQQANWQSSYESMSPESKAPAIAAMLQSGALAPLAQKLRDAAGSLAQGQNDGSALGAGAAALAGGLNAAAQGASAALLAMRGRTGVTKLNSTQVFSGAPPAKMSITILLKAYQDPASEVMRPLQQLMEWIVPKWLAPDGLVVGAIAGTNGRSGLLNSLLPSEAPTLIEVVYGGRRYPPMVIESIEEPITSPRDRDGNYVECVLPMMLATLTAQDSNDIRAMYARRA